MRIAFINQTGAWVWTGLIWNGMDAGAGAERRDG
jgi:hypothetical protein